MNRLALALGITSVIFAGTTVYFARELHRERASDAAGAREPVPAVVATTATDETTVTAVPDRRNEAVEAGSRKAQRAGNADIPARPYDPDKLAQETRDIRRNYEKSFAGLRQYLDLTEDEYNRLLDILSEQAIRNRDATAGCVPSAGCDIMSIAASQRQINRRQLTEFMGAEKAQRFRDYIDNFPEREQVANFRGRLPDALRLTDAQAEKLTEVLGEERRRIRTEGEQRGTRFGEMQGQYGSVFYPVTAQGLDERFAQASEYLRRQRGRAAEVLTAGQLEAFTQRQQESLEEARGAWESEDRQAARTR